MTPPSQDYPTEAARLLAEWCAARGVSQSELSRRVGRSRLWVHSVISGAARYPGLTSMATVAEVTGIPFDDLVVDRPAPRPPAPKPQRPAPKRDLTMAEVRQAIAAGANRPDADPLSDAWRQEILRHIDRLPVWFDRPLNRIPADARRIGEALDRLHPVSLRVTKRVWQKAHSAIRTALAIAGATGGRRPADYLADPRWRRLMEGLRDHHAGRSLTRSFHEQQLGPFFAYCHAHSIGPDDVSDAAFEAYAEERNRCDLGTKAGARRLRSARNAWNYAAEHVAGWPPVLLAVAKPDTLRLPLDSFPKPFQDDVAAYVKAAGVRDAVRFDPAIVGYTAAMNARYESAERMRHDRPDANGRRHGMDPSKPLAEVTARRHADTLRLTASVLVRAGGDPAEIRSIADIATPEAAVELLKDLDRRGLEKDKATRGTLVKMLASIAARWLPDHGRLRAKQFWTLAEMVSSKRTEMSDDDRRTVEAFLSDSELMARIVMLPLDTIAAAEEERRRIGRVSEAMALKVEAAVMLTILLSLPVRRTTLSGTRWPNITWPAHADAVGLIYWPPEDVKGRKPLRAELSSWKTGILRLYRDHYWPVLTLDPESPFLFPGRQLRTRKSHRTPAQLACNLKALIRDAVGHQVRTHQWRKILGTALFRETLDPDMVRALLGHCGGSASTDIYVDSLKTLGASATLDRIMSDRLAAIGVAMPMARAA